MATSLPPISVRTVQPSSSVIDPVLQEKELAGELQKHGGLLLNSVCNTKELARLSDLELTKRRDMLGDGFAVASTALMRGNKPVEAEQVQRIGNAGDKLMRGFYAYEKMGACPDSLIPLSVGTALLADGIFFRNKKQQDNRMQIIGSWIDQMHQGLSKQLSAMNNNMLEGFERLGDRVEVMHVNMMRGFKLFGVQLYEVQYVVQDALSKIATDFGDQLRIINIKMDSLVFSSFVKCCSYVDLYDPRSGSGTMEKGEVAFYGSGLENVLLGIDPKFSIGNGSLRKGHFTSSALNDMLKAAPETIFGYLLDYAATIPGVTLPTGISGDSIPNLFVFGLGVERYLQLRAYGKLVDYDSKAVMLKKIMDVATQAATAINCIQTHKSLFEALFRRYNTQLKRLQDLCNAAMDKKNAEILVGVADKARANNARIVAATEKYSPPTMTMTGAQYLISLKWKDNFIAWDSAYAAGLEVILRSKTASREVHGAKIGLPYARQLAEVSRVPLQAFAAPQSGPDASPRPVGKYASALLHKYIKTIPLPLSQLKLHPESVSCTRLNTPAEFFAAEQLGLGHIGIKYYSTGHGYDVQKDFTHFTFAIVISFELADGRSLPIKHYDIHGENSFVEPDWNTRLVNYRERGAMQVSFSWQNIPESQLSNAYVVDQSSESRVTIAKMIQDTLVAYRKQALSLLFADTSPPLKADYVDYNNALEDLQATFNLIKAYGQIAGFSKIELEELDKLLTRKAIEDHQRGFIKHTSLKEDVPYFPAVNTEAISKKILERFSKTNGVMQNPLAQQFQILISKIAVFSVSFVAQRALQVEKEQRQKEEAERQLVQQAEERGRLFEKVKEMEETIAKLKDSLRVQGEIHAKENEEFRDVLTRVERRSEEAWKAMEDFRIMVEMMRKKATER